MFQVTFFVHFVAVASDDEDDGRRRIDDVTEIRVPRRQIIVEPILLISSFCDYPLTLITSLYSYQWFEVRIVESDHVTLLVPVV